MSLHKILLLLCLATSPIAATVSQKGYDNWVTLLLYGYDNREPLKSLDAFIKIEGAIAYDLNAPGVKGIIALVHDKIKNTYNFPWDENVPKSLDSIRKKVFKKLKVYVPPAPTNYSKDEEQLQKKYAATINAPNFQVFVDNYIEFMEEKLIFDHTIDTQQKGGNLTQAENKKISALQDTINKYKEACVEHLKHLLKNEKTVFKVDPSLNSNSLSAYRSSKTIIEKNKVMQSTLIKYLEASANQINNEKIILGQMISMPVILDVLLGAFDVAENNYSTIIQQLAEEVEGFLKKTLENREQKKKAGQYLKNVQEIYTAIEQEVKKNDYTRQIGQANTGIKNIKDFENLMRMAKNNPALLSELEAMLKAHKINLDQLNEFFEKTKESAIEQDTEQKLKQFLIIVSQAIIENVSDFKSYVELFVKTHTAINTFERHKPDDLDLKIKISIKNFLLTLDKVEYGRLTYLLGKQKLNTAKYRSNPTPYYSIHRGEVPLASNPAEKTKILINAIVDCLDVANIASTIEFTGSAKNFDQIIQDINRIKPPTPELQALTQVCDMALLVLDDLRTKQQKEVKEYTGPRVNYYAVLGIAKNATLSDIKKAYRSLSKTLHPDKQQKVDALLYKEMNEAYKVLQDTEARDNYDKEMGFK